MIGNILGSISPHWEELQSGSIALAHFSSDNITTVVTRVGSLDAEEVKVMIINLELYLSSFPYTRVPSILGVFDNCYRNGSIPVDVLTEHDGATQFMGNNIELSVNCVTKIILPIIC